MITFLRNMLKNVPTLLTALALAVAVWIAAVTSTDPTQQQLYPRSVQIEFVGQDTGLILTTSGESSATISISAPTSIWDDLLNQETPIRAIVDLSGLEAGTYDQPVQIQLGVHPAKVISFSPETVHLSLEPLASRVVPVRLMTTGEAAVGYQVEEPVLNQETIMVSGPESLVNRVAEARAYLNITNASELINRELTLSAVDSNELVLDGVTLSPAAITVRQPIIQRYGYRNVVVKVNLSGEVANGYRLTNISVFPAAVTVYSANPAVINSLPGYIETAALDISSARDDLDLKVPLNLPEGVSVEGGETEVLVRVSIAAIESSMTLTNLPVELTGLPPNLTARISPETVNVILSGPVILLERLNLADIRVVVDVSSLGVGTYKLTPKVEILIKDIKVDAILPETLEVEIIVTPTATVTPTPTRTPKPGS